MWGRSTKNKQYARLDYACQTFQTEGKAACPQHNVPCDTLDSQIMKIIRDFAEDEGFIATLEHDLVEMAAKRNPDSAEKASELKAQLGSLDKQMARARELCLKDMITQAEFETENRRIKAEKESTIQYRNSGGMAICQGEDRIRVAFGSGQSCGKPKP